MTQQIEGQPAGTSEQAARDQRYLGVLRRLVPDASHVGDRAALATLRRALGKAPGESIEAYPIVYRALGGADLPPWAEEPYFIVAPLFALYPEGGWPGEAKPGQPRNLGVSFARLAQSVDSGSIEKRFQALLDSRRRELPERLRHAVSLLRAHEAPIDWLQLLRDLRAWDADDRRVQRRWARAYWGDASAGGRPTEIEGTAGSAPSAADRSRKDNEEDEESEN